MRISSSSSDSGTDGTDGKRLDVASMRWMQGKKEGRKEDDMVAQELGVGSVEEMSEVQMEYKEKIKGKLEARSEEIREKEQRSRLLYEAGQNAYERGWYPTASKAFEQALDAVPSTGSLLAGEIQLWLALSYDALGRYEDCLQLYRNLESNHPSNSVRKRASELRFILEAPRLELGEDERVKIPIMEDPYAYSDRRFVSNPRPASSKRREKTLEERFLEDYRPPKLVKNRYWWIAMSLVLTFLAAYSRQVLLSAT